MLRAIWRFLASLQFGIGLIVLLIGVLATATILETIHGTEFVRWYVYGSQWFHGLLLLLSVNIAAAALIRFPWKWRQLGFLLTHVGILVLLAGAMVTFTQGIEGTLKLAEGDQSNRLLLTDRSQLAMVSEHGAGQKVVYSFSPGPTDWPADRPLDFGTVDGTRLRVLRFYRHARPETQWVSDPASRSPPLIELQLLDSDNRLITSIALPANPFAVRKVAGEPALRFQQVPDHLLVRDFLEPPTSKSHGNGTLTVDYGGHLYRLDVDRSLGSVEQLTKGLSVKINRYHANAVSVGRGRFQSAGDVPKNPMLELEVLLPGRKEPIHEVAYAKNPFVNLAMMRGNTAPIWFWYHHPEMPIPDGVEFLRSPTGKLYCRVAHLGRYDAQGEVRVGDKIRLPDGRALRLRRQLRHARQADIFVPVDPLETTRGAPEAAVHVELVRDDHKHQIWLRRGGEEQTLQTATGPILVSFDYEHFPLGFSLRLLEFQRLKNAGAVGDADHVSRVQLIDKHQHLDQQATISMNAPLTHGPFTIYQSGFRNLADGRDSVLLRIAYLPGRSVTYFGGIMICLGIVILFAIRTIPGKPETSVKDGFSEHLCREKSGLPKRVVSPPVVVLTLLLCSVAFRPSIAAVSSIPSDDWVQWRCLPVQDGGRFKPLDTLAWESLRMIANRGSLADPETGRRLEPTAVYLAMLFDWQGWHRPLSTTTLEGGVPLDDYFAAHQPDKWDRLPFLPVDDLRLRAALDIPAERNRLSPLELTMATIRASNGQSRPFVQWALELLDRDRQDLDVLESKGLELANRLWSYQAHRMGLRLRIIPASGAEDRPWISVASLTHGDWNDSSDPTGLARRVRRLLEQTRAAYLRDSAKQFRARSVELIATARGSCRESAACPDHSIIQLEVIYNHWTPFRWSWIMTMVALLLVLLDMGTGWKPFYLMALAVYTIALFAMALGFAARIAISGHAPITNMYESVIYLGLGTALLGLVLELYSRRRFVLAAASVVTTIALIIADSCPVVLDPSLRPLQPILRSNLWLIVHVMTITLSYAAFALALGIGNITLAYFLVRSGRRATVDALSQLTYRCLQFGVVLLAVGTFTGGIWADYSWGRFWGWDPKEVWALIALLGYLAVLHAKSAGWLGPRGLAATSILCFSLVIMAWYGVNFILGTGLHSYGFGGGGRYYVMAALGIQFLYVAIATSRFGSWNESALADATTSSSEPIS